MPTYKIKYDVVTGSCKGTVREDTFKLSSDDFAVAMALSCEGEDELTEICNEDTGEVVFPQYSPGAMP